MSRRFVDALMFLVLGFGIRSVVDYGFLGRAWDKAGVQTKDLRHLSNGSIGVGTASASALAVDTTSLKPMSENQLEFVFTVGLEGTGHHLMQAVYKDSPDFKKMSAWGFTPHLRVAHSSLFQAANKNGMWNMACKEEESFEKRNKNWMLKPSAAVNSEKVQPAVNATNPYLKKGQKVKKFDTVARHNSLVTQLKEMQKLYDKNTASNPQPMRVPLSALQMKGVDSGMISYPNFRGCYKLHYPVLDFLYDACDEAGVQCSHVYVYRHPLDVLKSTSIKRTFNSPGMVAASHLYTSHLKLIETQLNSYPFRNRGCLGFFDEDETRFQEWKETIRQMWGYKQQSEAYDKFLTESYRRPSKFLHSTSTNIIPKEIEGIFPAEHLPYLQVFLKAHERTLAVCRQFVTV
ncbi:MAG: hypothetical protein SGARI_001203 [Bacillariaceae sp.]